MCGLGLSTSNCCDWLTQVYINGEFVGGADILEEMENSGELSKVLKSAKEA